MIHTLLGINERNIDFVMKHNPRKYFKLADDKILTKELLYKHNIPTPKLYKSIDSQIFVNDFIEELKNYKSFVIKPANGFGGNGILVIKDYNNDNFIMQNNKKISLNNLKKHIIDSLFGVFSMDNSGGDKVLAEERIVAHSFFKELSEYGLPDFRIIVVKGKPVASMIRVATKKSNGKANLHAGGMAIGVDITQGKTTKGWYQKKVITKHPDTNNNLKDITIPYWDIIIDISKKLYDITKLGYLGVDITIDQNIGPLVLEINVRPGLEIQNVIGKGLKELL